MNMNVLTKKEGISMKDLKFLVIAETFDGRVDRELLSGAIRNQKLPEGVKQLTENSWLIDAHTSFSFLVSLAHNAQYRKVGLHVLPYDSDPIFLPPPVE